MNNHHLLAAVIAGAFAFPIHAAAEETSPLSFNVGITSDYLFRGISQTHGRPALQAGVDYALPSGFYIGAWASTITWVDDFLGKGELEVDVYGGYKGSLGDDFGYDVGYLTYNYPGHGSAISGILANPNTQELYAGLNYKWLSAKYSHATSPHFMGWYGGPGLNQNTRGSGYLELNANYDLGDGWTLIGHAGHQRVKNFGTASYTDWKLGASKDVGFGSLSLVYSDTNANGGCTPAEAYCWANHGFVKGVGPTSGFKDVSRGKAVLSLVKTF